MMYRLPTWFRQRTQVTTLIMLVIGVLMLGGAASLSISAQHKQTEAVKWSSHSFEVLLLVEKINTESLLLDQRAREFIYRRSEMSGLHFHWLAYQIPLDIQRLKILVNDSKTQSRHVTDAEAGSRAQVAYLDKAVNKNEKVNRRISEKMHDLIKAYSLAKNTRQQFGQLMNEEKTYLTSRQDALGRALFLSTISMIVFLLSGFSIIAFSIRSAVQANMTLTQKARLEERELRAAELTASEQRANEQTRLLTALNKASANLASEHDISMIVKDVVEYGIQITDAQFGAFFFVLEQNGEKLLHLEALAGVPRDRFPATNFLRATDLFVSHNADILIAHDIAQHPKFGKNDLGGYPEHHMPVRSYIGIPIISSAGNQIGSLLFGHSEPGRFSQIHTETVKGLAGITSIVIENAHLYSAAQTELEERKRAQQDLLDAALRQKLLLRELNHRVKNTLVTVQSIAMQTKKAAISKLGLESQPDRLENLNRFFTAFESRLLSLSTTHDLLVHGAWSDVSLMDAIQAAVKPLIGMDRVNMAGCDIKLSPNAAVTLNMIFHELSTNAIKYGAASNDKGRITIDWSVKDDRLQLVWREFGGPVVHSPDGIGFGSKLLERAVSREMKGKSHIDFRNEGIECSINVPLSQSIRLSD